MADPADLAVAAILNDAGLGWTLNIDLFRGEVKPFKRDETGAVLVPHLAAFCQLTGGPTPRSEIAENAGKDISEPSVQVRIRGNPGEYLAGQERAEASRLALQRAIFPGYMSITAREAAPQPLGQDDTESPEWSFNVDTMLEQI